MSHEVMLEVLKHMTLIFGLLYLYQIKHFLADYPFQDEYMLGKFKPGWDFLGPLLAHCAVHAVFTIVICGVILYPSGNLKFAIFLGLLDAFLHFFMDRIKAGPKYLGRFKPLTAETYPSSTPEQRKGNKYFWWSLGIDQGVHHCTHYLIIFLVWAKSYGVLGYLMGKISA